MSSSFIWISTGSPLTSRSTTFSFAFSTPNFPNLPSKVQIITNYKKQTFLPDVEGGWDQGAVLLFHHNDIDGPGQGGSIDLGIELLKDEKSAQVFWPRKIVGKTTWVEAFSMLFALAQLFCFASFAKFRLVRAVLCQGWFPIVFNNLIQNVAWNTHLDVLHNGADPLEETHSDNFLFL